MGGVGVVDRRQQAPLVDQRLVVDAGGAVAAGHQVDQGPAGRVRFVGQLQGGGDAGELVDPVAAGDHADAALTGRGHVLNEARGTHRRCTSPVRMARSAASTMRVAWMPSVASSSGARPARSAAMNSRFSSRKPSSVSTRSDHWRSPSLNVAGLEAVVELHAAAAAEQLQEELAGHGALSAASP